MGISRFYTYLQQHDPRVVADPQSLRAPHAGLNLADVGLAPRAAVGPAGTPMISHPRGK